MKIPIASYLVIFPSVILGLGVATSTAHAQREDLRTQLATLAEAIKKVVEEEKQTEVAVGPFTGPEDLDSNGGPGIQSLIIEELKRLKLPVNRKAELTVKGDYFYSDKVEIKLRTRVFDRQGNPKAELPVRLVRRPADVARIVQATISIPPRAVVKLDYPELFNDAVKKPRVDVAVTKVRATPTSPYAVEVLVKQDVKGEAVARPAVVKEGLAFVPIQKKEFYEVRVYNDSKYDAAVQLFLDGIDVFAFSDFRDEKTGQPRYAHYIVPAGKPLTIKGWHRTNDHADSFLVAGYAEDKSAALRVSGKVGTITAMFKAAWEGKNVPEDETGDRFIADRITDRGPPTPVNLREVTRTVGVLRDVVVIRYDRD